MNKIKEIEAFVAAIDQGSLARAAADQGVTPAMLGRRVAALETRLGVKLLHRTTRHLTLTPQGALFLDNCHRVLNELEYAECIVSESRHKATGHLNVFAPASFGRRHVAPHASAFVHAHPGVQIKFNLTTDAIDPVRDRYDVGICVGTPADENLVAVKLAVNRRVVCGTPAYFRRYGKPRSPDELTRHNCLVFNSPTSHSTGWHFRVAGKPMVMRVDGTIGCNDGELLTRWATEGLGLAWRSTWEVQRHLDTGELVSVLDEFELADYDIRAVYPPQRYLPARVRVFIDELRAIYNRPGYWSIAMQQTD